MTNDKTTIQLKESTKDKLDALKRADGESYESVVLMLIAKYNNTSKGDLDAAEVEEIARDVVNDMVVLEALE